MPLKRLPPCLYCLSGTDCPPSGRLGTGAMKDDQERNHPTFALIGRAPLSGLVVLLTLLPAVPLAQEEARAPSLAPARLGQLEGQVTVGPRLNARKLRFTLYPDLSGVAPSPSAAAGEEVKNVVLYLDSPALERAALTA